LFRGNVDNDVVLVLTVIKDGGVPKLHTEQAQVLNPVGCHQKHQTNVT